MPHSFFSFILCFSFPLHLLLLLLSLFPSPSLLRHPFPFHLPCLLWWSSVFLSYLFFYHHLPLGLLDSQWTYLFFFLIPSALTFFSISHVPNPLCSFVYRHLPFFLLHRPWIVFAMIRTRHVSHYHLCHSSASPTCVSWTRTVSLSMAFNSAMSSWCGHILYWDLAHYHCASQIFVALSLRSLSMMSSALRTV